MSYRFSSRFVVALVITMALLMMVSCDTGGNPKPRMYTVTFWDNGEYATMTVLEGHSVRRPVDPVSDSGRVFAGWRLYMTGSFYDFSLPVTSDLWLEATWESSVTVSFDNLFGSVETVEIAYGDCCPLPQSPQREGYVFLGWYKADGTAFSSSEVVTWDITVYAKWRAESIQEEDGHIPEEWFAISSDDHWSVNILGYSELMPEGMKESLTTLYVPSVIDGRPVRSVSSLGTEHLESVIVEDGVQVLDKAFCNSPKLKYVELPDSIVDIGSSFTDCTSLETISLPPEISSIHYQAFKGCIALEGIRLPQYVTEIRQEAFANCESLATLTIPDTVTEIGQDAFLSSGLETVNLEHVNKIGPSAFRDCTKLVSVTFGASPLILGAGAFSGCSSLSAISIPFVKTIEDETFAYCTALESVDFGNHVTEISSNAFIDCTALSEIVIPDHEIVIENNAFSGCTGVRKIDTGSFVESVSSLPIGSALEELVIGASVTRLPENLAGLPSLRKVVIEGPAQIEEAAFENCTGLEEIVLCDSVVKIGRNAFNGCTNLKSINLDHVTSIGFNAFNGCSSLKSVKFGEGLKEIGSDSFRSSGLTQVVIPETVTVLGSGAFAGCVGLKSATIGTAAIAGSAFSGCPVLETVTLMQGVKTIGDYAFQDCIRLQTVELPSSVESVGRAAFKGCAGLRSVSFAQDSRVVSIGSEAFSGCRMLESVDIPASVRTLGDEVFRDCSSMVVIDLSYGLTSIGGGAFAGCSSLKELVIPDSLTSLGASYGVEVGFLDSCYSLEKLVFSDNVTSLMSRNYDSPQMEGCTSLVYIDTGGLKRVHGLAWPETLETIIISSTESACSVPVQAFANKPKLVHLEIGPGVTSVWEDAFAGTENIEVLRLESMLGKYTWDGPAMGKIRQLSIGGDIEEITSDMLEGAHSLETISIGDEVAAIGDYAFQDCTSLSSITIPNSVQTIGNGAFSGLDHLENVMIEDGVRIISPSAFSSCTGLSSITIPGSVTEIGYDAFNGCTSLSEVDFDPGSSITVIPSRAFKGCTALTEISLPDGVTQIQSEAFAGSGLKELVIAGDVTAIQSKAFADCTKLESVTIGPDVMTIRADAFDGCTQLHELVLHGLTALSGDYGNLPFAKIGKLVINDIFPEGLKDILAAVEGLHIDVVIEGVSEIPQGAFENVQGLGDVTIIGDVDKFGTGVFKGSGLKSFVYENTDFFNVPEESFQNCKELETVTIGNVLYVYDNAFRDCSSLTDFITNSGTFLDVYKYGFSGCSSLTRLYSEALDGPLHLYAREYAFQNCTSLTDIRLSDAAPYAFSGCTALRTVIFNKSYPDDTMICSEHSFEGCTVTVLEIDDVGRLGSYGDGGKGLPLSHLEELRLGPFDGYQMNSLKPALSGLENKFTLVLLDGWTTLSTTLFQDVDCIDEVVFPATLESIDGSVFRSCDNLTGVEIPGNVKILDGGVFEDCVNLSDVVLGEGVESMTDGVFAGCTSLEKVVIPASVQLLDNEDYSDDYTGVFAGCTALSRITFAPESKLRQIGADTFQNCSSLEEIDLPEGLEVIYSYAFVGAALREVDIPASVTNLHFECENTVSVNIPEDSKLENFSFPECASLERVRLPASVTKIINNAFMNCNALKKINIPDAVTLVDTYAFRGVESLDEIEVGYGGFDGSGLVGLEVKTIKMVNSAGFKGNLPGARTIEISGCIPPNLKTVLNRCDGAGVVIMDGVTEIPDGVFTELQNIHTANLKPVNLVVIPESVTTMGANAFSDFKGTIQLMCGYLPEEWGSEWYGSALLKDGDGVTINPLS